MTFKSLKYFAALFMYLILSKAEASQRSLLECKSKDELHIQTISIGQASYALDLDHILRELKGKFIKQKSPFKNTQLKTGAFEKKSPSYPFTHHRQSTSIALKNRDLAKLALSPNPHISSMSLDKCTDPGAPFFRGFPYLQHLKLSNVNSSYRDLQNALDTTTYNLKSLHLSQIPQVRDEIIPNFQQLRDFTIKQSPINGSCLSPLQSLQTLEIQDIEINLTNFEQLPLTLEKLILGELVKINNSPAQSPFESISAPLQTPINPTQFQSLSETSAILNPGILRLKYLKELHIKWRHLSGLNLKETPIKLLHLKGCSGCNHQELYPQVLEELSYVNEKEPKSMSAPLEAISYASSKLKSLVLLRNGFSCEDFKKFTNLENLVLEPINAGKSTSIYSFPQKLETLCLLDVILKRKDLHLLPPALRVLALDEYIQSQDDVMHISKAMPQLKALFFIHRK